MSIEDEDYQMGMVLLRLKRQKIDDAIERLALERAVLTGRVDWDPDQPRDELGRFGETGAAAYKTGGEKVRGGAFGHTSARAKLAASSKRPGASRVGDEEDASQPPKPGESFTVFRVGADDGNLENKNAGNAQGVAMHLARQEGETGAAVIGGVGQTVTVSTVTVDHDFGRYALMNRGTTTGQTEKVGREASKGHVTYSFPKGGGWKSEKVVSFPVKDLHKYISEATGGKYSSFDDTGSILGGQYIREYAEKVAKKAE